MMNSLCNYLLTSTNVWNWGNNIVLDTSIQNYEYGIIIGEEIPIDVIKSVLMSD